MNLFTLGNASEYGKIVAAVVRDGRRRSPRNATTRDIGHTVIQLDNVYNALPMGIGRRVNPAIGAIEALQLIAGVARHDLVVSVAPRFVEYMDEMDGVPSARYFHGAYGARVGFQVMCAVNKLKKDPDTRQAVATLWDPYQDNLPDKHDYPCTIGFSFSVRDEKLDMDTVMRSNDVWLGLPYDMFQFTQLQLSVARSLGREPGVYRHTALSLHAYERDMGAITEFLEGTHERTYPQHFQPMGIGHESMPYRDIMFRALAIMDDNVPFVRLPTMTVSERWYHERIHGGKGDPPQLG
jgi:thymidylate synthase